MVKAIVSLSGGMDSATVLAVALQSKVDVIPVSFTYGSKHNVYENYAAQSLCGHYKVPFRLVDLTGVMSHFKSDLLLSGGDIPEGHYEEESMKRTVVPARNLIFCSVLAGIAVSESASQIWIGVHAGDHAIYPDCRPAFVDHMQRVIRCATDSHIDLITPFLYNRKHEILNRGLELPSGVPYHLTRTCYKNQERACGKCGACRERLESFAVNNVRDPILYE